MLGQGRAVRVLMAEDDEDDRLMIEMAWAEANIHHDLEFVTDGMELMERLTRQGKYRELEEELPSLVLLDINMPRKNGKEALAEIKENENLQSIPVVMLTTSKEEEDVVYSYRKGCSGYIQKSPSFDELVQALSVLEKYWLELVKQPGH